MLLLRPCCINLATKAIHWRCNHAAAISHRLLSISGGRLVAADQACVASQRTLATNTTSSQGGGDKSVDKSQQAIEKAEQLHKELNELIKAQKDRQKEEAQRSFGSSVIQFFKSSKSEVFNIFFAFVCGEYVVLFFLCDVSLSVFESNREIDETVLSIFANAISFISLHYHCPVLLAYQIHKMRAGIKKLLADQEEKKAEIDRLRGLLATLSKEDDGTSDNESDNIFIKTLAEKCSDVVRKLFEESEKRAGYGWILGRKLASRDSLETENLVEELQAVVSTEINTVIGDAAFTTAELKERRVAALKEEDVVNRSAGSDAQLGGLMDILEEVHKADIPDGENADGNVDATSGKVRRTRYAI